MKLKFVAAALVAVASLAACSPAPGTAVVVGNETYSRAQVAKMAATCADYLEVAEGAITEADAARAIALEGVVGELEAEHGQVDQALLAQTLVQFGPRGAEAAEDPNCGKVLLGYAKVSLIQNAGATPTLAAALGSTGVQLNPMYGTLASDGESFFTSSSLSQRVSQ